MRSTNEAGEKGQKGGIASMKARQKNAKCAKFLANCLQTQNLAYIWPINNKESLCLP